MKHSTLTETVTDALGEAWTSGSQLAHDLAADVVDRAGELGTTAAEQVSGASDKVVTLIDQARERVHPTPRRRSPWLLVALVVLIVVAGWWMHRRRRDEDTLVEHADEPRSMRDYRAAAGH